MRLRSPLCVALLALSRLASDAHADGARGTVVLQGQPHALPAAVAEALVGFDSKKPRVAITLAGDDAADAFAACASPVERFVLDPKAPQASDDRALAAALERAGAISLGGGTFLDWFKVLTPQRKATRGARALLDAHERGIPIACALGAAEFAAEFAPVARASIGKIARDPHEPDVDLAVPGLRLVEDVCIVTSARADASAERLFATVRRFGPARAALLAGEVGWRIDADGRTRVEGSGCVLTLDLSNAVRDRKFLRGARLSALTGGDVFALERRVRAARPLELVMGPQRPLAIDGSGAFGSAAWLSIAEQLAREPAQSQAVLVGNSELVKISADADSFLENGARARYLRLDVEAIR